MESKQSARKGFTLIELMIVVAIIGILAAIAIPNFANYRRSAQDSAAKSALKNLATAQEDYYLNHGAYANSLARLTDYVIPESTLTVSVIGGNTTDWTATASHHSSPNVFTYSSADQGIM